VTHSILSYTALTTILMLQK